MTNANRGSLIAFISVTTLFWQPAPPASITALLAGTASRTVPAGRSTGSRGFGRLGLHPQQSSPWPRARESLFRRSRISPLGSPSCRFASNRLIAASYLPRRS